MTFYQINTVALESFLDRNPWLQAALDTLDEKDAKSKNLNIEEFRAQCIEESLAREAEEIGFKPLNYKLKLAAMRGLDVRNIYGANSLN